MGAGVLSKFLCDMDIIKDENLLVGYNKNDDASVYKVKDDLAIVQTVDFFPPIVDDPYMYGRIAAANSLSDIYAMGATPKTALNLMCIKEDLNEEVFKEVLRGGYDAAKEAGCVICGGHTIKAPEPIYGLSVTGFVDPRRILTNSNAKVGDILILTKPLGIGILTTAAKAGMLDSRVNEKINNQMATLNKKACEIMLKYGVHSATDITGFGFVGHLIEMAEGSGVSIEIDSKGINYIKEAYDFVKNGIMPGGLNNNKKIYETKVEKGVEVDEYLMDIMYDPQTSGGLLMSTDENDADRCFKELKENNVEAFIAGKVIEKTKSVLIIR